MERRLILRTWFSAIIALLTWLAGNMAVALTPDGLSLMEFRNGLTVVSPLLESWNVSDPSPCSWGGINCTASGDVRRIVLSYQVPMLEGNISASLGKLKSLEVLWLDGNSLSGSIPPEIGNLSNLKVLSLSFQKLSGEIPLQLTNCSSLVELWLNGNDLTGDITTVLGELSKLPAIQQIGLDSNNFTGTLPPSIGNATNLIYLSLGQSYANGRIFGGLGGQIPKELGNLVNMTTLFLRGNSFSGEIPPELGNMRSLNALWLPSDMLNGTIPSSLGNMINLTTLDLTNNGFTGEIPLEIGHMTLLNDLGLAKNNLTGSIPSSLGNLVNLERMNLLMNSLTGPIPESFTSLVNLRTIEIGYNGLIGQIPTNLSKTATSLEGVYLQNNNMSGPIPMDFGRFMPNLTIFDIANNFFSGMLPDGLCQGGNLQWLQVGSNKFEGAIPLSLGNCPSLIQARLSDNQFTSIPDGVWRNSSLTYLDLSTNQLTGPLPAGLGAGSQVAFMDLSANRLTGDISVLEFSNLAQNLSVLNLAKNNFVGEIPASMAMCKLLFQVDLSYNSLTGAVPPVLANLSNLEEMYLQGNNLTRLDPRIYAGWASNLRTLNLAENPWNAPVATEIGSLQILQILNLSYGGFTGPIPSALEQLVQLEVLDLSHNDLIGEIPSELGDLMTSLVSVNVSCNRLTGSLPPAWVKFLLADPDSFKGNPGLCLQYNANNMCVGGSDQNITSSGGKIRLSVGLIVAVVFGIALAFVIFVALLFCWRRSAKMKGESKPAPKVDRVIKNLTIAPLSFTFDDIMASTENLSDDYIIGRGCHGVVYKATLAKGTNIVVKRIVSLDMKTALVHKSFWKEIESLGNAKHQNLVRLLGFMQRGETGFLLYDYVSNGDLRTALHDKERGLVLNWKERLQIAEGVAHGLAYLHHTYSPPIVHRDITSSNVLLDNHLEAQISDFGLSKVLDTRQPKSQHWSSTSPAVLGTYGYIAPEVGYSTVVSIKLDVYSYGVLLLELLTGKQPVDDSSFGESLHVAAWVKEKVRQNEGKMSESVLDPSLLDATNLAAKDEMLSVQNIALLCTRNNPSDRPAMKEVLEMFSSLSQRNKDVIENGIQNV